MGNTWEYNPYSAFDFKTKTKSRIPSCQAAHPKVTYREWLKPLSSNLSLRSESFRFALTFSCHLRDWIAYCCRSGTAEAVLGSDNNMYYFLRANISTIFSLHLYAYYRHDCWSSNCFCYRHICQHSRGTVIFRVSLRYDAFRRSK